MSEKLGAERLRLELERRCNYYFGGYDGGTRCQKLKGHDGAHLWESDVEQLLSSAMSQLTEQGGRQQ